MGIAHNSIALEFATAQKNLLDEEWSKMCPLLEGTEGTPEDCIAQNWGESKG